MQKSKFGGAKLVGLVAATALAGSLVAVAPLSAFADTDYLTTEPASADGYVSATAYRAAEPTAPMLGLDTVGTNNAWNTEEQGGVLNWGSPYYYIFGTNYNSSAQARLYNIVYNSERGLTADDEGYATPVLIQDKFRQGGPMASVEAYGAIEGNEAVWDTLPDVIIGNQKNYNYNSADFSQAAAAANGVTDYKVYGYSGTLADNGDITDGEAGDYGVIYDSTNIYTMIGTMYKTAEAADQAATETGKQLHYGDATDIAKTYELFVKGMQGYILQQQAAGTVEKKTVALVKSYDSETATFTLTKYDVQNGTASKVRLLEPAQWVATNLGETQDTATKDELLNCDLIIIGMQLGSGETQTDAEVLAAALGDDALQKTYWVDSNNSAAGSCYGVTMNSVENAQNFGRVLGMLYPECFDQADLTAYYYQNFYHINTGSLATVIDNAMDGVRNAHQTDAASLLEWNESDVANYDEAAVEAKLIAGMKYIESAIEEGTLTDATGAKVLAHTSYWNDLDEDALEVTAPTAKTGLTYNGTLQTGVADARGYSLVGATATDAGTYLATATLDEGYVWSDGTSAPKIIKWSIAVAETDAPEAIDGLIYNGSEQTGVAEGTGFTLTNNKATAVGEYTATATLDSNHIWSDGTTEAKQIDWSIAQMDINGATIASIAAQTFQGLGVATPAPVVTCDGVTLTEGSDYIVYYANNYAAGTARIAVVGTGNCYGTVTSTFTINSKTIAYAGITLSATSLPYTGKVVKPTVTVKDGNITLVQGVDYTLTYTNMTTGKVVTSPAAAGKVKITITGKGNYRGTWSKIYTITPTAMAGVTATALSKGFTMTWTPKLTANACTGYQIKYTTGSTSKSKYVTGYATKTAKVTGLAANTKYTVQMRAYVKLSNGTIVYGAWSAAKTVTTKA